ncbi:tRNA (cytosine(38)-C(5))-methyltransferase [Vespa crabro]|uniref:tRNA (cytosine(38)-C(5))-methyltransferase n=1 Tax=Vespa crabro TaxID=7445 RepID=UPI001F0120AC|nr:tRNA (cytosine(38)-C(5))-methyltransferase [Vespa crabro]
MRILELYSGIGGMHYAFRESGVVGNVIGAVDINPIANNVYKHNFPEVLLMNRNIESISEEEIINLNINMILMSPPCQPFTRVGLQKDKLDNRSCSLFHLLQIIPQISSLKYILLENVKGFENSETRIELLKCLKNCNFNYKELILSPNQFGIPNTRHRYYLLAKKKGLKFCFDDSVLDHSLSQRLMTLLPQSKHKLLIEKDHVDNMECGIICYKLKHILETCEESLYLIPRNILQKRATLLDIRTAENFGSCCFTKAYGHYIEGTGSVYCPFSEEIVQKRLIESTKYEKYSEDQLQLFLSLKLRYFTPKEVSRLMCFPEDFTFPNSTTIKQKYRLLGNSINVDVVSKLIFLLCTKENENI